MGLGDYQRLPNLRSCPLAQEPSVVGNGSTGLFPALQGRKRVTPQALLMDFTL